MSVVTLANADAPTPKPFSATFSASYRGIAGGQLTFALSHDTATGQYTYETRVNPSALARLIVSSDAVERSVMTIDDKGVRPLKWSVDDGKSGSKEDGHVEFDWSSGRARGEIKSKAVDLATEPGVQDRISVQIAVITALLRGAEPGTIPMIDSDQVKRYDYTRGTTQSIDTKLGKLDTVIYESTRANSNRISRFWLAPSLGYVPVRAEQQRKGKVETVMEIVELKQ